MTALPHYARDSRAFFPSPSPLADPCSSNRGTRKKNDRASSIVPARHRSSFPSFLFSDEKSWKRGHVSKLSVIRLGLKFWPNLFDILISFFLIQKSNFDQIFVPIIDQRHRKILAVHRLLPSLSQSESPQPRIVNKTIEPRPNHNSIVPRHGRWIARQYLSWREIPAPEGGGEGKWEKRNFNRGLAFIHNEV